MKKIEEKAVAFAKSIWEDYLINRDLLKEAGLSEEGPKSVIVLSRFAQRS